MSLSRNRILAIGLSGLLAIGIVGGTTAALAAPGDSPAPATEHRVGHPIKFTIGVIAKTCDLSREELKTGFKAGESINQIIEGKGGNAATCKSAVLAKADTRLQEAVNKGKITAEQKAAAMAKADTKLTRLMAAVPKRGHKPGN